MNTISEGLRVIIWVVLCLFMAISMILFALFYGGVSYLARKFAWNKISIDLPSFKYQNSLDFNLFKLK